MTTIQRYLLAGGTLDDLLRIYAIKSNRSEAHPNLVLLKYNQIASAMGERIVQESRGIILDESDGWRVVSRAFDKFFNHGEGHAAPIDWTTARVQEKVDGSLCVLYSYRGEWHVATSGMPDARGEVNGCGFSFAALFWRTFRAMGLALPEGSADLCYAFELTSPWNRVVVKHDSERLVLLGVRDRVTGQEHPVEAFADRFGTFYKSHIPRTTTLTGRPPTLTWPRRPSV